MVMAVLGGEADPSEYLQGPFARLSAVAPGDRFRDLVQSGWGRSVEPDRFASDPFDGVAVGRGPRQQVADRQERADGLAELFADLRVVHRKSQRSFRRAENLERERERERERDATEEDASTAGGRSVGFEIDARVRALSTATS